MPKRGPTDADLLMWTQLKEIGEPVKEFKFSKDRKFRFDFAIRDCGIEIEGGAWSRGRHTRGSGFIKDMEKYNLAGMLGWRVFRFTPQQVLDGTAINFIKRVLGK